MTAVAVESELRGSRWLYAEPKSDEVREWFEKQPLHDGMSHDPYVSGVVLIGASEKFYTREERADGQIADLEHYRRVWTPYISVSTRIRYFRDYVRHLNNGREDGPYRGKMKPVRQPQVTEGPLANAHLPKGFSLYATMRNDQLVPFVVYTARVVIYERKSKEVILDGEDSRMVPAGDEYCLMKARTGGNGRALGVAGMLVVGTGVASAEEVAEANDAPSRPAYEAAMLPEVAAVPLLAEELRERAKSLMLTMAESDPSRYEAFQGWYRERSFAKLADLERGDLETVVRKLERDIDQLERGK